MRLLALRLIEPVSHAWRVHFYKCITRLLFSFQTEKEQTLQKQTKRGVSTGIVAGIVVGILIVVSVALLIYYWHKNKRYEH